MTITVLFNPTGMDARKYDEVIKRLEATGAGDRQGAAAGRLQHTCYGDHNNLRVVDTYESPAAFEEFGAVLVPILAELGIDVGQPDVSETYHTIP